jgi:hypothetical protein
MAEVYNPKEYRNYIQYEKMDYLYDKVETYDYLKDIIQGKKFGWIDIQTGLKISNIICCIFDNHDEQRLASEALLERRKRKTIDGYCATISTSPTMIYFGQKLVKLQLDSGFGTHNKNIHFDYVGVPNHQKWMNGGKFDGENYRNQKRLERILYVLLILQKQFCF